MVDEHEMSFEPAAFLVDNIGLLRVGPALDVAMGNGRNAIFLAQAGFTVTGVDISGAAVGTALAAAKRAGVKIEAEIADLEGGYHIARSAYGVIICFNYLQRSLIPEIKEGLRPGGLVVYETYIIDQARFGRPHNPDYLLKYNELLDMFREFRCLRYREGIFEERKAIASLIALKP
jgi:SAM-dependent methyltransferase